MCEDLPYEEIDLVEDVEWRLAFDDFATHQGDGAGVVLQNDDGTIVSLSFSLDFPCSNNVAEYEAFVIGLVFALRMGIRRLRVHGDFKLVIQQDNEEFSMKEGAVASYCTAEQKLAKLFCSIQFEHVPRSHNKHTDVLATLASKAEIKDDVAEIHVIRNTLRATTTDLIPNYTIDEKD